jgi:hypothetical protein
MSDDGGRSALLCDYADSGHGRCSGEVKRDVANDGEYQACRRHRVARFLAR